MGTTMSTWMGLLLRAALRSVQRTMREVLAEVTAPDVPGARAQAEAAIQRRKKIPGSLRRWLCLGVRRIEASTVAQFKARLAAEIDRLA